MLRVVRQEVATMPAHDTKDQDVTSMPQGQARDEQARETEQQRKDREANDDPNVLTPVGHEQRKRDAMRDTGSDPNADDRMTPLSEPERPEDASSLADPRTSMSSGDPPAALTPEGERLGTRIGGASADPNAGHSEPTKAKAEGPKQKR
jgi:hypothetical protein